ncbi:NnrU family protein [Alisedimentitalea sp. MJ-SS2]|uniref:NnrU family protein n=1 Tax=Aliisedimentitalea sp. MJ-SS2 TaxID=3049795 RepID=UPI00290A903D|nr:NnrU family protein [Alisedimentitalea sp. MJ-SS2]MDU8929235.1 NnrU family protein [Alisedimentitalea sp. MJ-SS2]
MGWLEFAVALILFMGSHRIPAMAGLKDRLEGALGRRGYVIVFSVISTALLFWVIFAAGRAPYVGLWDQAGWHRWFVNVVMPLVVALAAFGTSAVNPFAFEGRAEGFDPQQPGIAGVTRQPLLWALALWSGAHLLANGDLAHVILFGLFLGFSVLGMTIVERRRKAAMGRAEWDAATVRTGLFPFAALIAGRWRPLGGPNLVRLVLCVLAWAMIWYLHQPVIGVSPTP